MPVPIRQGDPDRPGLGGGGGPYPVPQPLGAVQEVKVKILGIGTFKMTWRDKAPGGGGGIVQNYLISYTPITSSFPQSSDPRWAEKVWELGRNLGTIPATNTGNILSFTHSDPSKTRGYVQIRISRMDPVIGVTAGPASYPVAIDLLDQPDAVEIPDDVRAVGMGVSMEVFNGIDFLDLFPAYSPPANIENFAGVQIYSTNYIPDGSGLLRLLELGSMLPSDGSTAPVPSGPTPKLTLAMDEGLGTGTGSFGAGPTTTFTRTTGTAFDAGWVGRTFIGPSSGGIGRTLTKVDSVTDGDHLEILSTYNGGAISGNWRVLNQIYFWFVAVGRQGSRQDDPTAAPSVTL